MTPELLPALDLPCAAAPAQLCVSRQKNAEHSLGLSELTFHARNKSTKAQQMCFDKHERVRV